MKRLRYESLCVCVTYFLVLLCIAFWVRDIPNQPDAFSVTLKEISEGVTGLGDPASFAAAAIDLASTGRISIANEWYFNLWPPGFIFLQAMIIKVLGPEIPIIMVLQIIAAALFAILLVLFYDIQKAHVKSKTIAIILPLLIFVFPVSRVFLLQPLGITLGESFAFGCFLICILLAFRSVERSSLVYAALAGICLALSAYFRSQFEFILLVLTGWGVLFAIAIQRTSLRCSIGFNGSTSLTKTIVVVLLVAHAVTIPWRLYRFFTFFGKPTSWIQTTDLMYSNAVKSSEYLKSVGGGWVVAGAGNLVCRIEPSNCDDTSSYADTAHTKKLFFKTFFSHPVQWYSLKLDAIGEFWFSSLRNWSGLEIKPTRMDIVTNGFLLVTLIIVFALSVTNRMRSHVLGILLGWFNLSLYSAYAIIFSLAHFEVRYFYFPKIAGITMLLIVVCFYFRRSNMKT